MADHDEFVNQGKATFFDNMICFLQNTQNIHLHINGMYFVSLIMWSIYYLSHCSVVLKITAKTYRIMVFDNEPPKLVLLNYTRGTCRI